MKVVTVLGTRPEIIKLSPVIPLFEKAFDHVLIHTGQHYDYNMDGIFFKQLGLKDPDYALGVGSGTHAQQTSKMMVGIEEILMGEKPGLVVTLADTNTPLAAGIVAAKCNISQAHIESGCRSFNRHMPEEINRIVVDHISDILFAPDKEAERNLLNEGIDKKKIFLSGSTVVDACLRNAEIAKKSRIIEELSLDKGDYVIATAHRAENTGDPAILGGIIRAIGRVAEKTNVVFPLHPRTKSMVEKSGIRISGKVKVIEPLGYLEFLKLMSGAKFIMTDSGGIQEEADVLNVPCVIMRNETEWVELVRSGRNLLATTNSSRIVLLAESLLKDEKKLEAMRSAKSNRMPGASEKIASILKSKIKS